MTPYHFSPKRILNLPAASHDGDAPRLDRRLFLQTTSATALGLAAGAALGPMTWEQCEARAEEAAKRAPETVVKALFDTLSDKQKGEVCFAWDYIDPRRGLLRTRVANNWNVTRPEVISDYYTAEQQKLVREIFEGIIDPAWHAKIDQQLDDDAGGFGHAQSIAIFGTPGTEQFEFVMTGRHMTLRCDGNSADHVAFGGPIFYGHDAGGTFNELPDHPGNVFWEQALAANKVYQILDAKQREAAETKPTPREQLVGFQGSEGKFAGLPVSEMSADQQAELRKVLDKLLEPYRQSDRDEALACLKAQGGLEKCALAFYTDQDLGNDKVWDNWRLEGPSFVWHFRGAPHVHVWVNVAADPSVKLNA